MFVCTCTCAKECTFPVQEMKCVCDLQWELLYVLDSDSVYVHTPMKYMSVDIFCRPKFS